MTKEHTPEEIKYRLSDLGVQIGNIAINYITELETENAELKEKIAFLDDLAFKARDLAKDVMTFYLACPKSVYNKAKEFLES